MLDRLRNIDRKSLLFFLSIIGPGIITANVDNDAAGITTYSVAGSTTAMPFCGPSSRCSRCSSSCRRWWPASAS